MTSTSATVTFDFSGKAVLVTGGGTGIGLAIAKAFAAAGAGVVITGRRTDVLDDAVRSIASPLAGHVTADVSTNDGAASAVAAAISRHGRLDVVVSNAAAFVPGDITEITDEQWAQQRATNIDGLFFLARKALPLLERTGGTLIAVSSVSGLRGDWGQSTYNATKGAVSVFVRSLALDWGARGVRVNAVAPALTRTAPVESVTENPDLLAKAENRVALGRVGEPGDIAPPVLFLASEAARYVTGVVLPVDGGTSASTGQAHF
jgi:meso-butanediol dehydrogenase/(S,S)-butanediol dehydrogenase/diacetyl reductase